MPTVVKSLTDSNTLLYAVDKSGAEKRKLACKIIKDLVMTGLGVVSIQVAQEFFVIATKKLKVAPLAAKSVVDMLGQLEVVQVNLDLVLAAIDSSILSRVMVWEGLIFVSARGPTCNVLSSEGLGHDQLINGVRVQSLFRSWGGSRRGSQFPLFFLGLR